MNFIYHIGMPDSPRSGCPIAQSLELIGDRWTMILLRDMINGKTKYSEFLDSPEKIATNVLGDRLAKMLENGLVTRNTYQTRPVRHEYQLTERGKDLLPVLQALCRWGNQHLPGTWIPPQSFMSKRRR